MNPPPKRLTLSIAPPPSPVPESDAAALSGIHPIAPPPSIEPTRSHPTRSRSSSSPPPPAERVRPSTIPPRAPSSIPPRPASGYPPPEENLFGAAGSSIRFRPTRLNAAELGAKLTCMAVCEGAELGPLAIIDVGTTGFAAVSPDGEGLTPGSTLASLSFLVDGAVVWSGEAIVVHCDLGRFGARFTSGLFDLKTVTIEATLENRLTVLREQQHHLPVAWRASVSDLRILLESAKLEVEEFERTAVQDPIHHAEEEATLLAGLRSRWAGSYFAALEQLHATSKQLAPSSLPLARSYATSTLLPLVLACPVHRRAYEKPLGYAGDFRLMEMLFARDLLGDSLFGRFLYSVTLKHTLARTVLAREAVMREAVRVAMERSEPGPVRVLSMAAGSAIELRKFLGNCTELSRPLHLFLLDQDEAAHETAHRRLSRILLEQHQGKLPITLECLHFSVRQLILPQTKEEHWLRDELLCDLDLIYSAGLYDYLTDAVGRRLTSVLYSKLRPGGRLLIGNLTEMPDCTWMMDFVLGWPLVYRTEDSMLMLRKGAEPPPSRLGIMRDPTGHCLFLDLVRPG
jgi:extracellular factor (EF) 3-hydroxypalmitic acid methyl ester biosynthesis protein